MGNSNSSTSNTPNWKWYQVIRVERSSNFIKFFLDSNVEFSNKYVDYIYCETIYPYNTVHAGDYLQVNQNKSRNYNNLHDFNWDENLEVIRIPWEIRELAPEYTRLVTNRPKNYRRFVKTEGDKVIEYIIYESTEVDGSYIYAELQRTIG